MSNKIILHNDIIFELYVENDILHINFLNEFTDDAFKILSTKVITFIELCEEKNKNFYLILSFLNYTPDITRGIRNCLHYGKLFVKVLDTQKNILEKHLNGTLIITKLLISYIWPLITTFYKPIKPIKFIETYEEIDFSFCNK